MEKCFTPTVILLTLFLNERVIALGGGGGGMRMILIVLVWEGG